MKKTNRLMLSFVLVIVLSLAITGAVSADRGGNPKGTITAIDEATQSLTLETDDGPITVYLPDNFDYSTIAVDMYVVVRGDWDGEDVIYATTVRETTPEDEAEDDDDADDDDADDDDDSESNGEPQNVYCSGRKDNAHPLATALAETYDLSESEVMNMFCNGFSFGEIMLALQTQQMNGTPAADSLAQRQNGQGWGQIWQEAGLIGNAEQGTPPGQVDKPVNPGHGGTPPGQDKDKRNNPHDGDDDDD